MSWSGYPVVELLPEGYPLLEHPGWGVPYLPMDPPLPPPVKLAAPLHCWPQSRHAAEAAMLATQQLARTGWATELYPIRG
jgi:hypothetical protein